jgi:hypothetical protein
MVKTVKNVKNFCKILVLIWCYIFYFFCLISLSCFNKQKKEAKSYEWLSIVSI